ncbi:MarR family winged helix-turn-helix transcriptional regulator [Hydrogenophaga sp.]|uniref:MarR family winged helix-turn-helix transcriptional regulator n=1 Tax=Hydrogenophaga sp. TaxID=1904254 RepID=UPI0026108F2A|nr:MarR family winged helix-turn-helix transcriptional regulator [Hydrogenophaga sp.]MCW5655709.1 winged helix-turn-helix transcriptional regulator [Hydrogenophaga sp.]
MSTDTHASSSAPAGCTNFKLRQLTRRVTQHYDQHLAGSGLKITQYSLLTHVDRLGPLPPGELARRMDMSASTLSRNLQPLLASGWLALGEGADARSRLIHITDAGRELRNQARRRWKAAQLSLNALLGDATVVALHALLDQSLAAFHEGDLHDEE